MVCTVKDVPKSPIDGLVDIIKELNDKLAEERLENVRLRRKLIETEAWRVRDLLALAKQFQGICKE